MIQLSLSASDMAAIASENSASFVLYGTILTCHPSPTRFEDEVVPPGRRLYIYRAHATRPETFVIVNAQGRETALLLP